jgi:hypothetical protein
MFIEYKQWTVLEYVLTTDNSLVILTETGSVLRSNGPVSLQSTPTGTGHHHKRAKESQIIPAVVSSTWNPTPQKKVRYLCNPLQIRGHCM